MSRGMLIAEGAVDPPVEAEHHSATGERDERHDAPFAWLEADRRARGNVQPSAVRRLSIEHEPLVDLEEVKVRANLNWPVSVVLHLYLHHRTSLVQGDRAGRYEKLTGCHGMGSWTVTSFVPSGNVASIWTSRIISGTPSMTSLRLRMCLPKLIRSATERPSRAPSISSALMTATASG